MEEIINFFTEPYQSTDTYMVILELVAALLGILSVWFSKKENILVFPTGLISTLIYVYLLSKWNYYGDLIINVYYSIMSIYGWYMWSKVIDNSKNEHISISRTNALDKLKSLGIFVFTSIFVIVVYRHYNVMPNNLNFSDSVKYAIEKITSGNLKEFRQATPYLDTFTTGAAFVAMWLMANKKIENWVFWIAVNIVSVPLYFVKGYGFTGIQYFIFLILAILGYIEWRKRLNLMNN